MALHALNLLIAKQLIVALEHRVVGPEVVVVPPLCPLATSPYDFSQSGALIEAAERAALQWLADGGLQQEALPWQLAPHSHVGGARPGAPGRNRRAAVSQSSGGQVRDGGPEPA